MQAGKEFTDLFYALMAFLEIGLKLQADMGTFLMKGKRAKKD